MSQARNHITEWIAQGRVAPEAFRQALGIVGLRLGPGAWHAFLERLALHFQEGNAKRFEQAGDGEFRVAPNGEMILTGLRGKDLRPL